MRYLDGFRTEEEANQFKKRVEVFGFVCSYPFQTKDGLMGSLYRLEITG